MVWYKTQKSLKYTNYSAYCSGIYISGIMQGNNNHICHRKKIWNYNSYFWTLTSANLSEKNLELHFIFQTLTSANLSMTIKLVCFACSCSTESKTRSVHLSSLIADQRILLNFNFEKFLSHEVRDTAKVL